MARRRERYSVPRSLGAMLGSGYPPPAPYRALPLPTLSAISDLLTLMEDRRLFHPERAFRPALSFPRAAARLVPGAVASSSPRSFLASGVRFADPRRVAICVRRKTRREVIMASGRGGGFHRRPRRNFYSDVEC